MWTFTVNLTLCQRLQRLGIQINIAVRGSFEIRVKWLVCKCTTFIYNIPHTDKITIINTSSRKIKSRQIRPKIFFNSRLAKNHYFWFCSKVTKDNWQTRKWSVAKAYQFYIRQTTPTQRRDHKTCWLMSKARPI